MLYFITKMRFVKTFEGLFLRFGKKNKRFVCLLLQNLLEFFHKLVYTCLEAENCKRKWKELSLKNPATICEQSLQHFFNISFRQLSQNFSCSRGVMDSTMVFGTICSGSNPDGSAIKSFTLHKLRL